MRFLICHLPGTQPLLNYLERLPRAIDIRKVPGCFSKGFLFVFKVHLNSVKLFGNVQSPGMSLSDMTFWSKDLVKKTTTGFMCALLERRDYYCSCKHTYFHDSLIKSCKILVESGREENIKQKEKTFLFNIARGTKLQLCVRQLKSKQITLIRFASTFHNIWKNRFFYWQTHSHV